MRNVKILKYNQFLDVMEEALDRNIALCQVNEDKPEINIVDSLFESNADSVSDMIEPAIIALPSESQGTVGTLEILTDIVTRFVDSQQIKGELGFRIGNYLCGEYVSGDITWDEDSLCVSMFGSIGNRAEAIALAAEIMKAMGLSKILVFCNTGSLELTQNETGEKMATHRIRRLSE